ncbi:MAG: FAA hydrolase family protein [Proteobacteria bacterium]|nr:MAG: FAA hydrolase family protein [Pseudomonadota bacterium]
MRIVRFIDPQGSVRLGEDQGDGSARLLAGSLFAGLTATDSTATISRRLAPLEPVNILCIGKNYSDHAKEMGSEAPELPIVFMKPTSALNHPGAPIPIPAACDHGPEVDYEAELAVVIGKAARDVPRDRALDHVFGYTCANDISARWWQKEGSGGQWIRGKSFDGFCPLGPVLVTAEEIPDPQKLSVRMRLNGELMQDGNTGQMMFPVDYLIAELSRDMTLLPGTVILTGTPSGVGFARTPQVFLQPGDQTEVEVEKIGVLSNQITSAV